MPDLERPLLVWDGDCDFCRTWIARWRHETGDAIEFATYQSVADRFPAIPLERFRRSVVLIEPDGRVSVAAEAVFRSLATSPRAGLGWRAYRRLPGFAPLSERIYRIVPDH